MISERARILVVGALVPALIVAWPSAVTAAPPEGERSVEAELDAPEPTDEPSAQPEADASVETPPGEVEAAGEPEVEASAELEASAEPEPAVVTAQIDPSNEGKTAPELFDEGRNAYALGEYGQAVSKFEAAWLLSNEPALLFNLGQAYWQWHAIEPDLEYLRRARKLFENYDDLMRGTEGYEPAEVEGIVAAISAQLSAAEQAELIRARMAATPAPTTIDEAALRAEQRRRTTKALTISGSILITLGSLALATGAAGLITRGATGFSLDQAGGGEAGKSNPNSAEDDARLRDTYLLGGRIAFGGLIAGAVLLPVGISLRVTGGVRAKRDREAGNKLALGSGLLTVQF